MGNNSGDGNDTLTDGCPDRRGVEVQELGPADTGRWLITTGTSEHVLDLDARLYERRPGPGGHSMPLDHQPLALTRVQFWPRVGSQMLVWVDDPDVPDLVEHFRLCATIARIARCRPTTAEPG
jgi:hypothetical protein